MPEWYNRVQIAPIRFVYKAKQTIRDYQGWAQMIKYSPLR